VIQRILKLPADDVALHRPSARVEPEEFETEELEQLVSDMWETLYDSGGIGLAAVQIGVHKRVFVMDTGVGQLHKCWVMINPTWTHAIEHRPEPKNEGCLSLPGVTETMNRYPKIKVRAFTVEGEAFEHEFENLEAQCCQHEFDHMDGVTIVDKLSAPARVKALKKIKEHDKSGQEAWCDHLNEFLDEALGQDAFGTEGQNDPRGDRRK
jgi:peptide deformylase